MSDLQKELDAMNAQFKATIKANTVKSDFPKMKRTYTYKGNKFSIGIITPSIADR